MERSYLLLIHNTDILILFCDSHRATLPDMMAVGCDLNGKHYENGEAFQPSPLYKCTCIAGAIGCTPVFIQKPAGLLSPASLQANTPAGLRSAKDPRKNQQDTTYRSMPGVCFYRNSFRMGHLSRPTAMECEGRACWGQAEKLGLRVREVCLPWPEAGRERVGCRPLWLADQWRPSSWGCSSHSQAFTESCYSSRPLSQHQTIPSGTPISQSLLGTGKKRVFF